MSTHQPTEPLAPVVTQPVLGLHGEPCASCGAPLAADQRYCLNCGARRADARLPFRDILAAAPATLTAPPTAPAATHPASEPGGRSGTIAALVGLGVVLLALGMGVLIGNAGKGGADATSTPQVINLGGSATTPAGDAGTSDDAGGTADQGSTSKKHSSSASEDASGSSSSKAQNKQLKNLENLSPQQYQKKSQKLPKVVGTGGAPPPKDNKPAAGGGDFQEIG